MVTVVSGRSEPGGCIRCGCVCVFFIFSGARIMFFFPFFCFIGAVDTILSFLCWMMS